MGNLIDWTNQAYYADNWTELLDCMTEFLIIFGAKAFELVVAQAQKGAQSDMMTTALREMGLEVVPAQWNIPKEWVSYQSALDSCSEAMEDQLRADAGEFFIF